MENTKMLHMDSACAVYDGIRIKNLSIDIMSGGVTQLRTPCPDAVFSLIYGDIVPYGGFISVAGVNVTERNRNERRVSVMPAVITEHNVYRLLTSAITIDRDFPTVMEIKRDALKKKIAELKSQIKAKPENVDELRRKLKQTETDLLALGLKMRRRQSELELNLKSAKALLASLKKSSASPEHTEKMTAKVFSAQYELCAYTHKPVPDSMISERVSFVTERLGLSDTSSDTQLAFACAYSVAPMLILCMDNAGINMTELNEISEKSGITVCLVSTESADKKCEEVIDVKAIHFSADEKK